MSGFFDDARRIMEQPGDQSPTFDLMKNGLAIIAMTRPDAAFVLDNLKQRIRRLTWLDDFSTGNAAQIWRAARLCYEIRAQDGKDLVEIKSLSREDLDVLYDFPKHWSTDGLKKVLKELRPRTRLAGPASPIEADLMAKELVDFMES